MTQVSGAVGTHTHDGGHIVHESAAWNIAIGAGFAYIAARRVTAADAMPILTTFVAMLGLLSIQDLAARRVEADRLVSHGFLIAGYAIVAALSRPSLRTNPPASVHNTQRWRWGRPPELDEPDAEVAVRPARLRVVGGSGHRPRQSGHENPSPTDSNTDDR